MVKIFYIDEIKELLKQINAKEISISKLTEILNEKYENTQTNKQINLSNHELYQLGQALSYAVVYAKTEAETAEFAMLKVTVEGEIVKRAELARMKAEHDKMGCPFNYCDSNPPCKGKCHYA